MPISRRSTTRPWRRSSPMSGGWDAGRSRRTDQLSNSSTSRFARCETPARNGPDRRSVEVQHEEACLASVTEVVTLVVKIKARRQVVGAARPGASLAGLPPGVVAESARGVWAGQGQRKCSHYVLVSGSAISHKG